MKSLYVLLIFLLCLSGYSHANLFKVETTALCEFSKMLDKEIERNSEFNVSFICDNRYTIEVIVAPKGEINASDFVAHKKKLIENITTLSNKFQIIGFEVDVQLKKE